MLAGDPVAHAVAVMRWQSVPDEQDGTLLDVVPIAQELDESFIVVDSRRHIEHEVRIAAIWFIGQRTR